jgi:hypothetical protein
MKQKIKFLIGPTVMFLCVAPVLAEEDRATFGSCLAAIEIAQNHDNEWQAPFSKDECAVIAGKAIDAGYVLMNPDSSKKDIARAIGTLSGKPVEVHGRISTHRLGD